MKKISSVLVSLALVLAVPLGALAANDLTIDGDITIDVLTKDTAASTNLTLSSGSVLTAVTIESNYLDISLDSGSDLTLVNDGSVYFDSVSEQSGSGASYPSCPSSSNSLNITSTGTAVVRVEVVAADPACASSGGGGGGGAQGFLSRDSSINDSGAQDSSSISSTLKDIEGHWAQTYIQELVEVGVLEGRTSSTFEPNANINRAEAAKVGIILFGFEINEDAQNPFDDVLQSSWFYKYVVSAYLYEFVEGYSNDLFAPAQNVTRAEALKILMAAGGVEVDLEAESSFEDIERHWAYSYIVTAYEAGVVEGYSDTEFNPNGYITRAEFSKIAYLLNNLN